VTQARSPGTPPPDLDRVVADACEHVGIRPGRPRLLRHFGNAVYLIEDAGAVARVGYGQGVVERARTAVTIAAWLADRGFPATEPFHLLTEPEDPVVSPIDDVAVTFWRYYPQPCNAPEHDLGTLGRIARDLHSIDTTPPIALQRYEPLRSVAQATRDALAVGFPDGTGLQWLAHRIDELREQFNTLDFPLEPGLIHGDLYVGNLLWQRGSPPVVLGDWDSVRIGPREIDLAPTYTAIRFGLDTEAVDRFADEYGYDLRRWSGYPTLRAMREVSTLTALVRLAPTSPTSASELAYRLETLQRNDTNATWNRQ